LLVIALPIVTILFFIYITYYVKPKADYVSSRVDVNGANYQSEARLQDEIFKNRLFNPAIVKLLPKVWVRKEMKAAASILYRPEFDDVIDFAKRTNPLTAIDVQRQESERQAIVARNNSAMTVPDDRSDINGTELPVGNPYNIVYMPETGSSGRMNNNFPETSSVGSYPNYQQRDFRPTSQQYYQQRDSRASQQQQYQQRDSRASQQQHYQRRDSQLDPRSSSQQRPRNEPQQYYRPQNDPSRQ
jgi:hypothetical protein